MLGIRTTNEFINKFDGLCERLGYNRSEVIRYCLKKFFNEHFNNSENFQKARKEMF
jgi:metal-responsive CopG/Arc/MetJ family transcriptional regulator